MIQEILVAISFVAALGYLAWFVYINFFSKQKKCDGCAVHKLYEMKLERQAKSQH